MTKGPDAFRTISEVAEELNVPQHVLRFWETRFSQIRPLKRSGGRRFYRPEDVALLRGIRHLLYGAGYTIRGVQRILKEQGTAYVQRIAAQAGDGIETASAATPLPPLGGQPGDGGDSATGDAPQSAAVATDPPGDPPSPAHAEIGPHELDASYRPPEGVASAADTAEFVGREWGQAEAADHPPHDEDTTGAADWESAANGGDAPSSPPMASSNIDPLISRYAPGPLSARPQWAGASRPEVDDRIIPSRYHLTGDARENLQAALDEIRECRRLLHSALHRLQD